MRRLALILVLCLVCCSCKESVSRKATYPVTGTVLIDGKAVDQVAVRCISKTGLDAADPTESSCFTDKDGKFTIATYEQGDGVPVGSYTLTFQWGERNLFSGTYSGDKLNGKYSDAKTSKVSFEVKEGVPTDLGTIELSTK
jgi:hypothetical protein